MVNVERDTKHNSAARESLLEAACALFTEKGYAAVSTREVAERAQVNLGSIQYYFGSKAKLFIETVRHLMEGSGCIGKVLCEVSHASCRESASQALCGFILGFFTYLLRPTGPAACRLMFREIFSETVADPEMYEALVSTVAQDYMKPVEATLAQLIGHINPKLSTLEQHRHARSILGQCSFYVTHQPFQERIQGVKMSQSPTFEDTVRHVCEFSLRGLGVEQKLIDRVVTDLRHVRSAHAA